MAWKLILASASPRRAELLREAGYVFDIVPPNLSEPKEWPVNLSPEQCAESISYFKARQALGQVKRGIVIGADTVVALADRVFGKPRDVDDARRILQTLSGTRHRVITGLTLIDAATRRRLMRHDTTYTVMKAMSPEALERYLAGGQWQGKAGAYGIQDRSDAYIERIEGSFSNVVGLPLELLDDMLTRFRAE